jgi:hypothetical protein
VLQGLQHAISPESEDGVAVTAGDVTEGVSEEGLAHTDGADDDRVGVGVDEAEGSEFIQKFLVVVDVCGLVPAFQAHGGVQAGPLGADRGGLPVAAGRLVGGTSTRKSWWGICCWRASVNRSGSVSSMRPSLRRRRTVFKS